MVQLDELLAAKPQGVSKPTLYIATPAYGCLLTVQYLQCILQTQLVLSNMGYGVCLDLLGNESLITRARNLLTKRFLNSPATHLLFIDADITWSPEAVVRLVEKDKPVVSGVYPKKFIDWEQVEKKLRSDVKEPPEMMGLDYNINVTERTVSVENGFAKVTDAATGFMLIRRDALEALYSKFAQELFVVNDLLGANQAVKDYIAVFDCMIDTDTRRYLSEDFAFSRRWQSIGGEVFCDLAVPLGHTGGFHFEGDASNRWMNMEGRARQPSGSTVTDIESNGPMPNDKTNVLLALIPNPSEQVSLAFVLALTRLIAAFKERDQYCIQIKIFKSKNEACDFTWHNTSLQSCIVLDGMCGFQPEMILDMMASPSPLEVGVCPEAQLQWDKVKQRSSQEKAASRGLVYDVRLLDAAKQPSSGRLDVLSAKLDVAKIDRSVLEKIRERMPEQCRYHRGTRCMWFHEGIKDDRVVSGDEMFCLWWGGGVTANMKFSVSRLGNLTFQGSVLHRDHLR